MQKTFWWWSLGLVSLFWGLQLASPVQAQRALSAEAKTWVTIVGGTLGVQDHLVFFEPQELDGTQQTVSAGSVEPWSVRDATGLGAGWRVEMNGADFRSGEHLLTISNLQVQLSNDWITVLSGNTPPLSEQAVWPVSLNRPLKLLFAPANTGMGTYRFYPNFYLTIPASAYAGTYTAALAVAIFAGP